MITGNRIVMWLGYLLAGLLIGLLVRSLQDVRADGRPLLTAGVLFGRQEEEIARLRSEVESLRQDNEELLKETLSGQISTQRIQEQLTAAKNLAGILPVVGPGVVITLTDARGEAPDDVNLAERGLIHDYDLLYILNELKAAGAEAISVGSGQIEERVVNLSSIRCVGPTVVINNEKLTAPFTIKAIGDPQVLEAALNMPGGILDQLRRYGLIATIEKDWNLLLPGYSLPIQYRFLRNPEPKAGRTASAADADEERNRSIPVGTGPATN